jgi:hypothetical protein
MERLKCQVMFSYETSPIVQRFVPPILRTVGRVGALALMFALAWVIVNAF